MSYLTKKMSKTFATFNRLAVTSRPRKTTWNQVKLMTLLNTNNGSIHSSLKRPEIKKDSQSHTTARTPSSCPKNKKFTDKNFQVNRIKLFFST